MSGNIAFHMHVFPICACAIYYFLTQLPNARSRCHFALARCYLQHAKAMLLVTQRCVVNFVARTPFRFCNWSSPDTIKNKISPRLRLNPQVTHFSSKYGKIWTFNQPLCAKTKSFSTNRNRIPVSVGMLKGN